MNRRRNDDRKAPAGFDPPPGGALVPDSRVDTHVGQRIRMRRQELGLTTAALGEALGNSSGAHVEMNERGELRVGPARIIRLSKILHVPVTFFFEGL